MTPEARQEVVARFNTLRVERAEEAAALISPENGTPLAGAPARKATRRGRRADSDAVVVAPAPSTHVSVYAAGVSSARPNSRA